MQRQHFSVTLLCSHFNMVVSEPRESLFVQQIILCLHDFVSGLLSWTTMLSYQVFRRDVQSLSYPTKSLTSSWDLKAFLTTYGFLLNNLDTMHDLIGQKLMGYCGGKLTENLLLVTIVYKSKRKLVNDSPPAHDPQAFFMFSHNRN